MSVYTVGLSVGPAQGYTVASSKLPSEHVRESAGATLDLLEADFLARSKGRLVSRAEVYAGTVAGRELHVDAPEVRMHARIFVTSQAIYQVLVLHSPSQNNTDEQWALS